jgi:hypothetical protein
MPRCGIFKVLGDYLTPNWMAVNSIGDCMVGDVFVSATESLRVQTNATTLV